MSSENNTDSAGKFIDLKDFEYVEYIGRDGCCQVSLIQDKKTGQKYAAKKSAYGYLQREDIGVKKSSDPPSVF